MNLQTGYKFLIDMHTRRQTHLEAPVSELRLVYEVFDAGGLRILHLLRSRVMQAE